MLTPHIIENLKRIQERINQACERSYFAPSSVKVIGVTKTFAAAMIEEVVQRGMVHIGENRIQEALPKIHEINKKYPSKVTWHLIGHLQSNKVRAAVDHFDLIQSVDSVKLCEKISSYAFSQQVVQDVLLEVNCAGEATKFGFAPQEMSAHFSALRDCRGVRILGLMTIAPQVSEPEETRPYFRFMRQLRDQLQEQFNVVLPELSMGMSDDYPIAVEEGATMVRLGKAIFGERE